MRYPLLTLIGAVLFVTVITVIAGRSTPPLCQARWYGPTNSSMLEKAQSDLQRCDRLKVELMSFGGPIETAIEIAQEIRRARIKGKIVEIYGRTVVVSGAVVVLAAASPNHRYINKHSVVMIHGIQASNGFQYSCVDYTLNPTTEDEKFGNRFIELAAEDLAMSSGKSVNETISWLKCGNEQVGDGSLLIKLGLADKLEP